jgi:hypothetical protein
MQLQSAIALAVIAQSNEVGRYHMRRNRAKFLKSLKYKYFRTHGTSAVFDKQRKHEQDNEIPDQQIRHKINSRVTANIGKKRLPSPFQKRHSWWSLRSQTVRNTKQVQRLFTEKRVWYDSDREEEDDKTNSNRAIRDRTSEVEGDEGEGDDAGDTVGFDEIYADTDNATEKDLQQPQNKNTIEMGPTPRRVSQRLTKRLSVTSQALSQGLAGALQSVVDATAFKKKPVSNMILRKSLSMSAISSNVSIDSECCFDSAPVVSRISSCAHWKTPATRRRQSFPSWDHDSWKTQNVFQGII